MWVTHLCTDAGVPLAKELLRKTARTLSTPATRKGSELAHGEVAGEHRHDVEKAGLGFGIAKFLDALQVSNGKLHSGEISFVVCNARAKDFGPCWLPGWNSTGQRKFAA
jgi:hypothetical protein